jgi:hypothetical protein
MCDAQEQLWLSVPHTWSAALFVAPHAGRQD